MLHNSLSPSALLTSSRALSKLGFPQVAQSANSQLAGWTQSWSCSKSLPTCSANRPLRSETRFQVSPQSPGQRIHSEKLVLLSHWSGGLGAATQKEKHLRRFCLFVRPGVAAPHWQKDRAIKATMATEATKSDVQEVLWFGPWKLDRREVFLETKFSLAVVNLKPVVPGHVLVISKRVVPRFGDLSVEEATDLWLTARLVGTKIEPHFGASSLTYAIQDGPQAGQTVAHVHIHILPRKAGDFEKNDDVYDAIDANDKVLGKDGPAGENLDLDKNRKNRTMDEMAAEAVELGALFEGK